VIAGNIFEVKSQAFGLGFLRLWLATGRICIQALVWFA
jgi:hypothetical protein